MKLKTWDYIINVFVILTKLIFLRYLNGFKKTLNCSSQTLSEHVTVISCLGSLK